MKTKTKYIGIYNDEGSFVNFYRIKNRKTMGFKEFENKNEAQKAYDNQSILSDHDLAPKVYGKVRKIDIWDEIEGCYYRSRWGYITEIAETLDVDDEGEDHDTIEERSDLNLRIEYYCDLTFYDCHPLNYGYVKRKGKNVLVCIDTGRESFNGTYCY